MRITMITPIKIMSEALIEVLSKKKYDKTSLIIKVLDEKGEITPEEAKLICEKSPATIRSYFKLLIVTGYVIAEGNTNNIVYKVVKNIIETSFVHV